MAGKKSSSTLIVDLISLDVIVILYIRGCFQYYQKIKYCRVTKLGSFLLKILHQVFHINMIQCTDQFNDRKIENSNLAVIRERMLAKLMRSGTREPAYLLAKALGIQEYKVEDSLMVHKWKAFYYPCEAVVRSQVDGTDVLVEEVFKYPEEVCGDVYVYRRKFDFSSIVPRKNYNNEAQYQISTRWKALLRGLFFYSLALLMIPISYLFGPRHVKEKPIAAHVLRMFLDLNEKNDLFWMYNNAFHNKTLLIATRNTQIIGEARSISSIYFSLRLVYHQINNFYFMNFSVCKNFLLSFPKFLRCCGAIFKERGTLVFLPELIQVFAYSAIFKSYRTKVFTTLHSFYNSDALFACDMEHVVYVRSTVSNQGVAHPHIATSADVFLSWGEVVTDTYMRSGARGVNFVNVGFIDGDLANNGQNVNVNIDVLRGLEGKFRLGFFDNAGGYEHPNSLKDLAGVLIMFCELLQQYENLCIIYKSKSGDDTLLRKLGVLDRLQLFIDQGSFIILSGKKGYSNRPTAVARYLDLSVGFQISSAATETAIVGVPSVHINFTGIYEHFWEKQKTSFIYHDLSEAQYELTKFIENPNLLKNFSFDYISGVNHYGDFHARERMQEYVCTLCIGEDLSVSQRIKQADKIMNNWK